MKVLQLGKFYPIRGGVEKVMWDLTNGLSERGVTCDMLCAKLRKDVADAKDSDKYDGKGLFRLNEYGRVFCVPAWTKKAATMISPAMVRWLRKHKGDYDLIHVHHPDPMAALALRFSGFKGKVVLHWHSDILSQRFFLALYKPLQRWLIRRADKIVGTTPVYVASSPYLKDVQDKCTYVPIGIRPVIFNDESAQALRSRFQGKTILLSIGRLVPYKGFDVLIKAMKDMPENYHLILGGSGPLRGELEALIKSESLQERITMTGYVADEDLPSYYGACDMFVLSSVMKTEAFGIVQIEAMSCGKPVIATIIPESGVSWVNKDGTSGLNVTPGDSAAIASVAVEISQRYNHFSEGAKARFNELFTESNMIKSIVSIYEKLV